MHDILTPLEMQTNVVETWKDIIFSEEVRPWQKEDLPKGRPTKNLEKLNHKGDHQKGDQWSPFW